MPTESAEGSVTPAVTNRKIRQELDRYFGGDYLNQETVVEAARARST